MKSHSKSRRFFSSVETCVLTVADFFWTITAVFLETTLPRMAFVPLSGAVNLFPNRVIGCIGQHVGEPVEEINKILGLPFPGEQRPQSADQVTEYRKRKKKDGRMKSLTKKAHGENDFFTGLMEETERKEEEEEEEEEEDRDSGNLPRVGTVQSIHRMVQSNHQRESAVCQVTRCTRSPWRQKNEKDRCFSVIKVRVITMPGKNGDQFKQGDLVFAKMKGFPHWPARCDGGGRNKRISVYFFGKHQMY
ncbi:hypothetical protein F7725_016237, partial [Dissostichus mawsoni]